MFDKTDDGDVKEMMLQFIYAPCDSLSRQLNKPTGEVIQKIIEVPLDRLLSIVDERLNFEDLSPILCEKG